MWGWGYETHHLGLSLNQVSAGCRSSIKSNHEPRRTLTAVLGGLAQALNCVSLSVNRVPWLHCRGERNVVADWVAGVLATQLTHTERHIPQFSRLNSSIYSLIQSITDVDMLICFPVFERNTCSLSCSELEEKIDASLPSAHQIQSFWQEMLSLA